VLVKRLWMFIAVSSCGE